MAKHDRQLERLNNMSGGGQIGGTNAGQTAGTAKENPVSRQSQKGNRAGKGR